MSDAVKITITTTPEVAAGLEELVADGYHGTSKNQAAERILARAIFLKKHKFAPVTIRTEDGTLVTAYVDQDSGALIR